METQGTCFLYLNRDVQHHQRSLWRSQIHTGADRQGKEKLLEAAVMQHLTWHQASVFKLLDQAQYASSENSLPRKGGF